MVLFREPHAFGRQPVHVPGRSPNLRRLPRGLEQLTFSKSHEDRIQRAGLQPRIAADVISVDPVLRGLEKHVQNLQGLWRQAQFHPISLHM